MRSPIKHPFPLRRLGLTLVEMLVVMGICFAVALLLAPVVLRSRAGARRVVCANNLNALGQSYAICVMESNNALPDVYYTFSATTDGYEVALRTADAGTASPVLTTAASEALVCPSDDKPVEVIAQGRAGGSVAVGSSYAYNISLPVAFRNGARVAYPTDTVTFYDGNAHVVVGTWAGQAGWAANTIVRRHRGLANYLFLDGHVENLDGFPAAVFDGARAWPIVAGGPPTGTELAGAININPNNRPDYEFYLVLPDGFTVTRDDLHADQPVAHSGFNGEYLEYNGIASSVRLKPKGNGNQNGLIVGGQPYPLENKNHYLITSGDMTVHLYNDKRNKSGKAMGHWWIEITAKGATIQVQN